VRAPLQRESGWAERLSCPVRGCGLPLARAERALRCERGHAFDVARSGYVNLLQPQDRRSPRAGDEPETVLARERLARAGVDRALVEAVRGWHGALEPAARTGALLDVGCGIGTCLAAIAREGAPAAAYGVDLSVAAVERAARAAPELAWLVANADRRLPFLDASLDVALSIKGPKSPAELARVLAPGGHLLLALPAPDDLAELRSATAGGPLPRDPAEGALASFAERFALVERREVREQVELGPELLRDLLRVSYRGARASEARRAERLAEMRVTLAATLLHLRTCA
jgi:23S rRNA (guanine745-N1)-methyltransferase